MSNADCPTVLLDDIPSSDDAFGAHTRVANAIVGIVTAESGGKAIGLEGGWGSGKSTIINLIRTTLEGNDTYRLINFDAWAHDGDPLRRTYLESIIGELVTAGWINKSNWDRTLEEITNRRSTTTTRITPNPTKLGAIFAISLIMIPIGSSLIAIDWTPARLAGFVLLAGPLLVLAANTIRWLWRRGSFCKRSKQELANNSPEETEGDNVWAFLLNNAINETITDTTESPNPTSIEFESYFDLAMQEALGNYPGRRLMLVLDNLDRIDADSARSIWSTMQTFFQERKDRVQKRWFRQIWVIVPYDTNGIRRLWEDSGGASDTATSGRDANIHGSSDRAISQSFLDKSFQVRFQVPLPVLSDWKTYLHHLARQALPDHEEDHYRLLYRVYDEFRDHIGIPPTPRELKIYVNQVGAIHRQWQHDFPLGAIAYFVLLKKSGKQLTDLVKDSSFPPRNISRLLGKDVVPSLAGLTFNVEPEKGMEFLLLDPIYNALISGDHRTLLDLQGIHQEGFWAVFEKIVENSPIESTEKFKNIVTAIHQSGVLTSAQCAAADKRAVSSALKEGILEFDDWSDFDTSVAAAVIGSFELFKDQEYVRNILGNITGSLVIEKEESSANIDKPEIVKALLDVYSEVKSLGFSNILPNETKLPISAEVWPNVCETIVKEKFGGDIFGILRPDAEAHEISVYLTNLVETGEFSNRQVPTIKVTSVCIPDFLWDELTQAIETRLNAQNCSGAPEAVDLLKGLWGISEIDESLAYDTLRKLVINGHLFHHFQSAKEESELPLLLLSILRVSPSVENPQSVGNSNAGYQRFSKLMSKPSDDIAKEFMLTAELYSCTDIVWKVIESRGSVERFSASCIQLLADSGQPSQHFPAEVLIGKWRRIKEGLDKISNDSFYDLLHRLSSSSDLLDVIVSSEHIFAPTDAELYWHIIKACDTSHGEFTRWCQNCVAGLSKDQWLEDLRSDQSCLRLLILSKSEASIPELTTPFSDALELHASEVLHGQEIPSDEVVQEWGTILSWIKGGTRIALRKRLLDIAISANGILTENFVTLYGDEIRSPEVIEGNAKSIEGLFSIILRERNAAGLDWLIKFIEAHPDLLNKLSPKFNVDDFLTRLQDNIDSPQDDDIQKKIDKLGNLLGLTRKHLSELDNGNSSDDASGETQSDDADQTD